MRADTTTVSALLALMLTTTIGVDAEEVTLGPMKDPEGVFVWVSAPAHATVGERITLVITIENARDEAAFHLADIVINEDYAKGFVVDDAEPVPAGEDATDGDVTLSYDMTIEAGMKQRFHVYLIPRSRGVYIGDVDVWGSEVEENGQFCTERAQTRVE